jgi:GAF domain-containing protein
MRQEDVDGLAEQIVESDQVAIRRARERELDTLLETSLALVSRLELTDLLKEIAERLTRLMNCHFCAISTLDEESQALRTLAFLDNSGHRLPDAEQFQLSRFPLTRHVLEEQVAVVVNLSDHAADPAEARQLEHEGGKSLLMVPLVCGGRSIGLLELVDHLRERHYSRQELRICRAVAAQAAIALHNAESFAGTSAARHDLDNLCGLLDSARGKLDALSRTADVGGLLKATATAACKIFDATSGLSRAEGRSRSFAIADLDGETGRKANGSRTPQRRDSEARRSIDR